MKKAETEKKIKKEKTAGAIMHRGKVFQGKVIKKFDRRVAIEFERTVKILKYERFAKKKTKIHARIPEGMEISVGDYVKVGECRPLSKIIHFVVLDILRRAEK